MNVLTLTQSEICLSVLLVKTDGAAGRVRQRLIMIQALFCSFLWHFAREYKMPRKNGWSQSWNQKTSRLESCLNCGREQLVHKFYNIGSKTLSVLGFIQCPSTSLPVTVCSSNMYLMNLPVRVSCTALLGIFSSGDHSCFPQLQSSCWSQWIQWVAGLVWLCVGCWCRTLRTDSNNSELDSSDAWLMRPVIPCDSSSPADSLSAQHNTGQRSLVIIT